MQVDMDQDGYKTNLVQIVENSTIYITLLSTTQSQPPPRAGIMRDFRQSCSNFGWPQQLKPKKIAASQRSSVQLNVAQALALLITKAHSSRIMLVLEEGNFEIFHSGDGEDHIVIINGGKIMKRYNGSIIFCEEKLTQVMYRVKK